MRRSGSGMAMALVASFAVACTSTIRSDPATTGADQNQNGSTWQAMVTCEDGSVIVDVDTSERRHLQLVVREAAAFPALDATITYGEITNPTERIYRADSPFGVFGAGDVRHFRAYDVAGGKAGRPGIDVLVEGGELRLRQLDLSKPDGEPTTLDSNPPDDVYPAACETANYVFHGCQAK